MALPQHDGKHGAPAVITPEAEAEYGEEVDRRIDADLPDSFVLVFQPSLFEHVVEAYDATEIDAPTGMFDLYRVDEDVGVVGDFGIGAPVAAMAVELLAAEGVGRFLIAGYAGCLRRDVAMGDVVVCTRALRDEGVSHHYLEPGRWVPASESLVAACESAVEQSDARLHTGPTWTISVPYRETVPE